MSLKISYRSSIFKKHITYLLMITYLLNDKSFHCTKPEARVEVMFFFGNFSVSHTTQALGSQSTARHTGDLLHDRAMWSHLDIP